MNLPLILDVAISLILIYLILSLLASEIQELLSTLLQWRAVHLRNSIATLLGGGDLEDAELQQLETAVDDLYHNPLITNINHEAKEGVALVLRQITWWIADVLRSKKGALGRKRATTPLQLEASQAEGNSQDSAAKNRSGPSYIPASTFATTLLNRLEIPQLAAELNAINLWKATNQDVIQQIQSAIDRLWEPPAISPETKANLEQALSDFQNQLESCFKTFNSGKITLNTVLEQVQSELSNYISDADHIFTDTEENAKKQFQRDLSRVQQYLFSQDNAIDNLVRRLTPTLTEIVQILDPNSPIHHELETTLAALKDPNSEIYKTYHAIQQRIQIVSQRLPVPVRSCLTALATRAQIKATNIEQELSQFQKEIENWFDHSMERAAGVYTRNAKAVAFVIGLLLAFTTNTDTLYLINRLSVDTSLRTTIVQNAGQVIAQNPNPTEESLQSLSQQTQDVLQNVALPIGWGKNHLQQHIDWTWGSSEPFPIAQLPSLVFGWIVSGVAIAMGAPFWFDVLSKVINVRNTGKKPPSTIRDN